MATPPIPTKYIPWVQWFLGDGRKYFGFNVMAAQTWWKANVKPLENAPPIIEPPAVKVYPDQLWVPLVKDGVAGMGNLKWNGKQFDLAGWKSIPDITPPPYGRTRKYTDYELGAIIGKALGYNIPYGTSDSWPLYGFPVELIETALARIQDHLNIVGLKELSGYYLGGSKMCGDYAHMTMGVLRFWFPRIASCYVVGNMAGEQSHAWNVVVDCDEQVWEVDVMYGYKKNISKDKTDRKYVILNR